MDKVRQLIVSGYVSPVKQSKGMDDIDRWAEGVGDCERNFNDMRITRRNRKKAVGVRR